MCATVNEYKIRLLLLSDANEIGIQRSQSGAEKKLILKSQPHVCNPMLRVKVLVPEKMARLMAHFFECLVYCNFVYFRSAISNNQYFHEFRYLCLEGRATHFSNRQTNNRRKVSTVLCSLSHK